MPSQQRLVRLQVKRLKNLSDIKIEFDLDKQLTAILGPNGFGKSTILHALAASFQPQSVQQGHTVSTLGEDYRYIDFFPNTPHGTWATTDFDVVHSFREGANLNTVTLPVSKGTRQWIPLAKKRPEREVHLIGISSSVPAIELNWPRSKITYTTNDLSDIESEEIKQKVGFILNRAYTRYHNNQISNRVSLIGAEFQGVNYSALAMGAGEQRLFYILKKIKAAGNYALILIDEIDLLMHTDALHRLLNVLNEYADSKKLQIVFTTHRESVVKYDAFVAIRHIYRSPIPPYKSFCFEETKPDALTRLTGMAHKPLSIYCEDDVSTAILAKVALQAGVLRFTEISCFGAAKNSFTLAAALLLSNQALDSSLFVLDGDVFRADNEKQAEINKALSGNSFHDVQRRADALSKIVAFDTPVAVCPEQVLHTILINQQASTDPNENEVINAAHAIGICDDAHEYVDRIISTLGESRAVGLRRIVDVAAKSHTWDIYVAAIKPWLETRAARLIESVPNEN